MTPEVASPKWRPFARVAGLLARVPLPLVVFAALAVLRQIVLVGQLGSALDLGAERLVLSTLGTSFILGAPLLARRRRLAWLALLDFAWTLSSIGDLLHHRAFGDLPSVASLRYAGQLPSVASAAAALVFPSDLVLLALGPIAFMALRLIEGRFRPVALEVDANPTVTSVRAAGALRGHSPSVETSGPWRGRKAALVWACIGMVLVAGVFATTPRLGRLRHRGNAFLAGELGLLNFHLWEAGQYLGKRASRWVPDPEAERMARERLAVLARDDDGGSELWGAAKGRSVIVVQLESFQAFAVGLRVGGQPVTPNLDALAKESLHFVRYFHQTAAGRTSDAQFISSCSLHAAYGGAAVFEYAGNDLRCLPRVLAEAGYTTLALQTMGADYWNASVIEPKLGFQRSYKDRDFEQDERIGYGLSDRSFFRQAVEILATTKEPFFASLLSLTSHAPYDWPNLPRALDLGSLEGTYLGRYLHAVHYTDRAVGELVAALRERGLLDRAVLVVYGDHDGVTRRSAPQLAELLEVGPEDDLGWTRVERGIPLFVRLPGGEGAGPRDAFGAQIDLAPTLLGLLGLPREGTVFLGHNLLGPAPEVPRATFVDGSAMGPDALSVPGPPPACFGHPDACAALDRAAAADLAVSAGILEKDLSGALSR